MKGYLKNPKTTAESFKGGWFHTGDLAVMDPDGYIALKDRSKDVIISGGENISTIEIQNIMITHPAIRDVAVVAKPDEKWGETPCAFVELKDGATLTEAELIRWCKDNMPRFMAPKNVVFQELPKTSTGKIQKFVLRDQAKALKVSKL
jgi:fatty-acyl-CoA synthase